jgi:predicted flap endonuclease-1-like 5' DNA nuclease
MTHYYIELAIFTLLSYLIGNLIGCWFRKMTRSPDAPALDTAWTEPAPARPESIPLHEQAKLEAHHSPKAAEPLPEVKVEPDPVVKPATVTAPVAAAAAAATAAAAAAALRSRQAEEAAVKPAVVKPVEPKPVARIEVRPAVTRPATPSAVAKPVVSAAVKPAVAKPAAKAGARPITLAATTGAARPAAKPAAAKKTAHKPAPAAPRAAATAVAAALPAAGKLSRPKGLTGARGGKADNLQRISGVGPKNEKVLHSLGFFHFDQIAEWTAQQIDWVDDHLKFGGRIKREEWVRQARLLADGKEAEFTRLYGSGGLKTRSGETVSGSRTRRS